MHGGLAGADFKPEECFPNIIRHSLNYINEQKDSKKPFFLYLPFTAPHTPILPSKEFQGTPIIRSKDNDGIIQLFILLQCFYDLAHHVVYHDYEIAIRTDTGFALKLFRRQYRGVRSSNRQI